MSLLHQRFGAYTPMEVGKAATAGGLSGMDMGLFFREFFNAAQGLSRRNDLATGVLVQVMQMCAHDTPETGETRQDMFARKAYEIADAMLKRGSA